MAIDCNTVSSSHCVCLRYYRRIHFRGLVKAIWTASPRRLHRLTAVGCSAEEFLRKRTPGAFRSEPTKTRVFDARRSQPVPNHVAQCYLRSTISATVSPVVTQNKFLESGYIRRSVCDPKLSELCHSLVIAHYLACCTTKSNVLRLRRVLPVPKTEKSQETLHHPPGAEALTAGGGIGSFQNLLR